MVLLETVHKYTQSVYGHGTYLGEYCDGHRAEYGYGQIQVDLHRWLQLKAHVK